MALLASPWRADHDRVARHRDRHTETVTVPECPALEAFRYACWLHVTPLRTNTYAAPASSGAVVLLVAVHDPGPAVLHTRPDDDRVASHGYGRPNSSRASAFEAFRYAC